MALSTERLEEEYYKKKIESNKEVLDKLKSKLRVIPYLKLLCFIAGVLFVVGVYRWEWDRTVFFAFAALSFLLFFLLYKIDERYLRQRDYLKALESVYRNELCFLEGDYSPFDDGARFVDKKHPFSYDMDVFGKNSIYQMINRTETEEAAAILAEKLAAIPASEKDILARQQSLAELAEKDDFRHRFMAICKGFNKEKSNYGAIADYKRADKQSTSRLLSSKIGLLLIVTSLTVTLASVVLAWMGFLPNSVPVILFLFQLFIPMTFNKTLNRVGADIGLLHKNTMVHSELLDIVDHETFKAELNHELKEELLGTYNSKGALRELSLLLKKFDQRHNAYILVLLNGFFLRDLFLLRKFYRWTDRYSSHIELWIKTLAELEARVSQATYMFNQPGFTRPELTDRKDILVEADGLGHPFIPSTKRVNNDILINKKQFLIITGANMAGKSTFLRTVGANYVLAVNGMNVCASTFSFSLFHLFSSMRNTDDLSSGTSYFKAELERMRTLIRYCRSHPHTLIILDELLKGTNSKDKLDGSVLFLKKMTELPVTGIIATHDLELAKLENEQPGLFLNYCFEISLSEEEQYSYKIQRGVSRNLNATYLLQKILSEEFLQSYPTYTKCSFPNRFFR